MRTKSAVDWPSLRLMTHAVCWYKSWYVEKKALRERFPGGFLFEVIQEASPCVVHSIHVCEMRGEGRWDCSEGGSISASVPWMLCFWMPWGRSLCTCTLPPTPGVCEATIASLKMCYWVGALSLHREKKKDFYSKWGNALKPQLWSKAEGFSDNLFMSVQPGPTVIWLFLATSSCPAIPSGRLESPSSHFASSPRGGWPNNLGRSVQVMLL